MKRSRVLLAGTVAATAAAVLSFGGLFTSSEPPKPTVFATASRAEGAILSDARRAALRGYAQLARSQRTGDPALYPLAERSFRHALSLSGADALALRGLAAVAASRHRFDESLEYARRAQRLSPGSPAVYGLLGDAQLELGRYEAAIRSFDRMAELRPSPVAYARVSYARELLGDTEGAIAAMRLAVEASVPSAETNAWSLVHLGNLFRNTGRPTKAARHYREALVRRPGYGPALDGLADVAANRGQLRRAVALSRRALAARAEPDYAVGLGDALARLGRPRAAEEAYRHAAALERRFASNGGRNQLETALFDLDHDRNLADALRRARIGRELRPSVEGEHVLAWALYKNDRCAEARRHSLLALRLGTKDVGALYHRSLIERCLGNADAARAFLDRVRLIDPYFLATAPSAARG